MNTRMNESEPSTEAPKKKGFFALGEVAGYFFRKKDPSRPKNFNLRAMHIINKISILIFLVGVIMILVRRFF